MENLLKEISQIDRKLFLAFLFKSDLSDDVEHFQLWRYILKPIVFDRNIKAMEATLSLRQNKNVLNNFKLPFCRSCSQRFHWIPKNNNADNIISSIHEIKYMLLVCLNCDHIESILNCKIADTVQIIIESLERIHPQLYAQSIYLAIKNCIIFNSITPPEHPENPFEVLNSILRENPDYFKFGSTDNSLNCLTIADIYLDKATNIPVLYLIDSTTIPPRYFFKVLKFRSKFFNPVPSSIEDDPIVINSATDDDNIILLSFEEEYLIKELMEAANQLIKVNSNLVIGKFLQNLIDEKYYNMPNINLKIVPYRNLNLSDSLSEKYNKHFEFSKTICVTAITILTTGSKKSYPDERRFKDINLLLTSILWILCFKDTPFESVLYHVIYTN